MSEFTFGTLHEKRAYTLLSIARNQGIEITHAHIDPAYRSKVSAKCSLEKWIEMLELMYETVKEPSDE